MRVTYLGEANCSKGHNWSVNFSFPLRSLRRTSTANEEVAPVYECNLNKPECPKCFEPWVNVEVVE